MTMVPSSKDDILSWLLTHAGVESESSRLLIYNTLILERDLQRNRKPGRKFEPPAMGEFITFFKDHGYTEELAMRAYKGYEAGGWHDSTGKQIKNWRQKVIHVWFTEANKPKNTKLPFGPLPQVITYNELINRFNKGDVTIQERFERVEIDGKPMYKEKL